MQQNIEEKKNTHMAQEEAHTCMYKLRPLSIIIIPVQQIYPHLAPPPLATGLIIIISATDNCDDGGELLLNPTSNAI
jgi:hypothetical protein